MQVHLEACSLRAELVVCVLESRDPSFGFLEIALQIVSNRGYLCELLFQLVDVSVSLLKLSVQLCDLILQDSALLVASRRRRRRQHLLCPCKRLVGHSVGRGCLGKLLIDVNEALRDPNGADEGRWRSLWAILFETSDLRVERHHPLPHLALVRRAHCEVCHTSRSIDDLKHIALEKAVRYAADDRLLCKQNLASRLRIATLAVVEEDRAAQLKVSSTPACHHGKVPGLLFEVPTVRWWW